MGNQYPEIWKERCDGDSMGGWDGVFLEKRRFTGFANRK